MSNSITKETFKEADEKTKLDILFDIQISNGDDIKGIRLEIKKICEVMQDHPKNCETRITELEKRKLRNSTFAGFMGFTGGFMAVFLAKLPFFK